MTNEFSYTLFETVFGWVGVVSSNSGLIQVTLPRSSRDLAFQELDRRYPGTAQWTPALFLDLERRLNAYFKGERTEFNDKLDYSGTTAFQRSIREAARLIPYGETRSYAWVAQQAGRPAAYRAAGQVLAKNPLLIIVPCHRVVASNGSLCGFGGGLEMKQRLLNLEAGKSR